MSTSKTKTRDIQRRKKKNSVIIALPRTLELSFSRPRKLNTWHEYSWVPSPRAPTNELWVVVRGGAYDNLARGADFRGKIKLNRQKKTALEKQWFLTFPVGIFVPNFHRWKMKLQRNQQLQKLKIENSNPPRQKSWFSPFGCQRLVAPFGVTGHIFQSKFADGTLYFVNL